MTTPGYWAIVTDSSWQVRPAPQPQLYGRPQNGLIYVAPTLHLFHNLENNHTYDELTGYYR